MRLLRSLSVSAVRQLASLGASEDLERATRKRQWRTHVYFSLHTPCKTPYPGRTRKCDFAAFGFGRLETALSYQALAFLEVPYEPQKTKATDLLTVVLHKEVRLISALASGACNTSEDGKKACFTCLEAHGACKSWSSGSRIMLL